MSKPRIPSVGRFIAPDVEPFLANVCDLAFKAGERVLQEVPGVQVLDDAQGRLRFFRAAHEGFAQAQEFIADRILEIEKTGKESSEGPREIQLLRKVMDGVAWQLIAGQLYVARRLYRESRPPRLTDSNFKSVRGAARHTTSADFSRFSLISDLTTFVQVGDLLTRDANTGQLTIGEVKEGRTNEKIMDFMNFFAKSECPHAFAEFVRRESPKVVDQMARMARQAGRMSHVADVLNTGKGTDPDSGLEVVIAEEPVPTDSYDNRLVALIDASHERGWAIDIVEGGLYLGAYRQRMLPAAGAAFDVWINSPGEEVRSPTCNLLESMVAPLGLPLFNRRMRRDQVYDLLFGRCAVMIGLHLPTFIEFANERGLKARWSSRKEASFAVGSHGPFKVAHRAICFESGDEQLFLSDGSLVRLFFHGETPAGLLAGFAEQLRAFCALGKPDSK